MKKYLVGCMLLFYIGTLTADQEGDFIAAREAFRVGKADQLAVYATRLQNYVLEPYIDYYRLRLRLDHAEPIIIRAFLSLYQDSYIADKLRAEWLHILGKNQQWDLFSEEYPLLVNNSNALYCYSLQQRLAANDKDALTEARPLWFTGDSMPDSCTPIFNALIASELISVEDIWVRIRMAFETGHAGVAKYINRHLPGNQALNISKLNAAAKNPLRYLEQQKKIKTRSDREIALYAVQLLLRSDTNRAYVNWLKISDQLTDADQSYFYGILAYRAALRHDSRTLDWFSDASKANASFSLTDTQLAWKTRAALRDGNWQLVLQTIESMSASAQQTDTWRYWKARALKANTKISEANTILAPLSTEHDFYGQLAKEELGTILSVPTKSYEVSAKEIAAMQQVHGIKRALEFFRLGMRIQAVREWNWTIREFDDAQLLAAAKVAQQNGIYDRAINTAEKTIQHHDFNLRFLAPHRHQMHTILQQHALDEAWVYGLIRQESRFIANIKSHAGAMGLMQVMPATAKWVAKKLGMQNYRDSLAVEINTNLRLGTYYLKHVLTSFDGQPLLASAAYNAGPGRAKRWRDTKTLEGAVYAETIPFRETRDYVKKVLNNSIYYAKVLDHDPNSPTLKQRLGVVAPE
jgi:peptidoglycan lytic transglycosylase